MTLQLQHLSPLAGPDTEAAVVRLADRVLCEQAVRAVRRQLPWLVGESARRGLHLDLGAVLAPTAGGLGGLIALHHRLRAAGEVLVLFGVTAQAHEVFRITGLTALLDVRPGRGLPADA